MEMNRRAAPLYGQVEAEVKLPSRAPEAAEVYVVLRGSRLTHVTLARGGGGDGLTFSFTVPGHDLAEVVSVTSYVCADEARIRPSHEGDASLEYVKDGAQEAAEYLSAHREQLHAQSHLELLRRFRPAEDEKKEEEEEEEEEVRAAGLRQLDEKMTQAMANMETPQEWKNTESQQREVAKSQPRETPLHLAVRLGLEHLCRFLIQQPRGQRALTSPNQEGDTPLQLAQRDGRHAVFRVLAASAGPGLVPASGVCNIWSDGWRALRFCPGTNSLTLTVRQSASCVCRPEDAIMVLRDRRDDPAVIRLINELRGDSSEAEETRRDEGVSREPRVDQHMLVNNVFEEQLVLSLDDDDDEDDVVKESPSSLSGHNNPPVKANGIQSQFTQNAPDPPLHINDQKLPSQPEDLKLSIGGVTRGSTGTDGELWEPQDALDILLDTDTPPPPLSPADRALARLICSTSSDPTEDTEAPPMDACDLSPSLVALELDSEEDGADPKSPLSLDAGKSEEDKRDDASRPAADLTCTRSHSASAAFEPAAKDSEEQGIRLRSYSYSSPKITLRPPRLVRDGHASDISTEQRATSISEQSHDKRFRSRAQSADDDGSVELAQSLQHLTLSEFLKEIEEEELDKYSIPTKAESEKYKVIRTFSFLKSRMSSTRSKTKGKGKEREAKDKDRQLNGHRFGTGSCLGPTVCVVCDKAVCGKDLLHCASCTSIVHKGCKESLPPCLKKLQDKYAVTSAKNRTASLPQNFTVRDSSPQSAMPAAAGLPVMAAKERKDTLSGSPSGGLTSSDGRLSESSETESDTVKGSSHSEEPLLPTPTSSTSAESSFGEDCVDACIHGDISADAADYEAESWSLTVEHKFCKRLDKRAVERQDVIYELMQTELHHLQTLHIMAEVFRRGMREEVQLDAEAVTRVFPCLDRLLVFHHGFFGAMKERRHDSAQPQGHRNYLIRRIGDVLLQQFSEDNGEIMKQVYGEFCSRHNEAVSFFKELLQHNKRFQNFIKQQGNNYLVRRREIPECILLVTQRITKYPVLLERILQYTQEDTEEYAELSRALAQIREVIAAVDLRVSELERQQRLQEVWSRMENRSSTKLKNGHTFRKQDMMGAGQALKHQGLLLWKTATGRLKDVLALLLTDALVLLQEKDQKYTFAAVDQKPSVIALQKLIVREVANEERGMFLISASSAGPEMYEVHTSSKEERNTWMRLVREAVESCPEEEEEYTSESEEEKRAAEARVQKIHKFQESLQGQDQQICCSLEEKLQIYGRLSALSGGADAASAGAPGEQRLLVRPHSEDAPQAAELLAAALQEAENLRATLSTRTRSPSSHGPDSDSAFSPAARVEPASDSSEPSPETPDSNEGNWTQAPLGPETDHADLKVSQSVHSLTQLLYSLQAAVTLQDSCFEVQRLLLREAGGGGGSGRPSPHAQRHHHHLPVARGNTLQEQEKQRNLEKQKEEVAAAQRLQDRLRLDKERWERECHARESQQGGRESRLEERERQCHLEAERLRRERQELDAQLEEYQQSLERLREGQRSVERERERLESRRALPLLHACRHGRQSSLPTVIPHMVIPLDGQQDSPPQTSDLAGNGSVFVNEAALAGTSVNNRHHKKNDPSTHNCLNSLLARSNSRQGPLAKTPLGPRPDPQAWVMGTGYLYNSAGKLGLQHTPPEEKDPLSYANDPAVTRRRL